MVNQRKTSEFDASLQELHLTLKQTWGTDYPRLAERSWLATSDLIATSSLSHRTVTHLLQLLDPWLENLLSELPAAGLQALVTAVPRSLEATVQPSTSKPDEE